MDHFCSRQQFEEEDDTSGEDPLTPEDIELVQSSISKIKQSIVARIEDLEARIESHQQKMASIFNNRDDLKDYPYSLRASFHHDGLSGTGHHWAYIWVEPAKPAEENLLQDIPLDAKSEQRNCDEHARGGGWFKFCDASVEPVTENDIYADPVSPFALLYTAADSNAKTLPRFTKEQLYNDWMPNTLKEFITADNELFEKELYSYNNPSTIMDEVVVEEPIGPSATSYTSPFHNISKAANQVQIESNHQSNNSSYLFSGQPFLKLRDRVNNEIVRVSTFPKDDYRLLKSFEVFLARTQHHLNLEHLYLLYSKDKAPSERYNMVDNNVDEDEIEADYIVDEKAAKEDSELKLIWKEYESYSAIGTMITQALIYFSKKDFANALQQFLDTKRVEASWKTQVMLDTDLSTAYSGLESISFNDLVKRFGKACLQILNRQAYMKAINPELRTIGLQDAIKIAQQAQMIIGPDYIQEDPLYQTFKEVWLSFTENPNVMAEGTLTSQQAELLNSLFMIYLEGHVGGIDYSARSSATVSRCTSPVSSEHTDFDSQTDNELPIWQRYKEACEEANQLLSSLSD
ncbi:hypothetical protein BDF20DRAFT_926948 [Mycotypha africana]|uniref:uncharacterized protein n=1 Tax=Mycotypha africana TaxID=64632 RepID=UPI0023003FDA|nr:uncharacterized protein BDF20DRAFT_926948 [Mycotypha africana]KAI8968030.1 hypothetical protein BDF20DRAFT_926948 [Mycotypha africana]